MVDAAADVDPAFLTVNIFVAQALGLAAAAAGIIDQEGKQAEVVVQVVLDLLDLISGRRVAVLLVTEKSHRKDFISWKNRKACAWNRHHIR